MYHDIKIYEQNASKAEDMIDYKENFIERIFKESVCDVQIYHMKQGKILFIEPLRSTHGFKSYYLLEGQLKDLAEQKCYEQGDAFLSYQMSETISLLMMTDTKILVHAVGISIEDEFVLHKEKLTDLMEDLYLKDPYERGHSERVLEMVKQVAIRMNLCGERLYELIMAGRFFDIGKIHIDEKLLKKEEKLSYDEIEIIRFHVTMSDKLIRYYYGFHTSRGILEHHEHWDGSGYPVGLKGEAISLDARIIAVCDSFDAMTHKRPYRAAYNHETALNILKEQAGKLYDPEVVRNFLELYSEGLLGGSAES